MNCVNKSYKESPFWQSATSLSNQEITDDHSERMEPLNGAVEMNDKQAMG